MRMNGQFVPVDPRVWNTAMDVSVNVGLGTGKEEQKAAAYQQALGLQMQIWQAYGPQNGLVTMTTIRNTLADMMALAGIRNTDRYFNPMDPQTEAMLVQQAQQMAAQRPDPNMALAQAQVQAEQIKAQSKAETDMLRAQIDAQKAIAQDDRERDKMDQDLILSAAKLVGEYGKAVDIERIKAEQRAPRYPEAPPTEAVQAGGQF
jgi:hypothetical protein